MPKVKTHRGTKKRVRLTKNGKAIHRHARMNHFLEKKSASRKRRLNQTKAFSGSYAKNIKRKLGASL
jgi:large subunit ribosomal protein L35